MYELDKAAFGHFLAQLRREKGMTQKELAATLYVSDKAVSKWERGLSVPDISLLVPLAEQLNVTVAELLQGRWVEEERRFTREETEELIRKALTFSAEPPERRQVRTKKYLPVYVICCVLGVAEALAVWAAGLADIEGALALLITSVVFGVVYGAYAMFWMAETLPRYYDENRICNFAQGAFHIHIPGIYYTVSYTHLDVYKRQGQTLEADVPQLVGHEAGQQGGQSAEDDVHDGRAQQVCQEAAQHHAENVLGTEPVSYTHLRAGDRPHPVPESPPA